MSGLIGLQLASIIGLFTFCFQKGKKNEAPNGCPALYFELSINSYLWSTLNMCWINSTTLVE